VVLQYGADAWLKEWLTEISTDVLYKSTVYFTLVIRKPTQPKGDKMMYLLDLQIYLLPCVTLTFAILTPKVDHLISLPYGLPFVLISIKIDSFTIKISCS